MKKQNVFLGIVALALVFVSASAPISRAQTPRSIPPEIQKSLDQMRVTTLRDRGISEATGRLAYFELLLGSLEGTQYVPAAEKAQISAQLKIYISRLTQAKAKLETDTTTSDVIRERQTVAQTYLPYKFYTPKVRMIFFADRAIALAAEMKPRLSNQIYASKLTDVTERSQKLMTTLLALSPEGYPDNATDLVEARKQVGLILDDLKLVRQYLR